MLYSMTGYGRAERLINNKNYIIELRSLNGKQFDLRLNMPSILKPFEFDIRSMLNEGLSRGTVECIISIDGSNNSSSVSINKELAKSYYNTIKELSDDLSISAGDILPVVLKLPDVITNTADLVSEEEFAQIAEVLKACVNEINDHRQNEGAVLEKDLLSRIEKIESLQPEIASHEEGRRGKIKENLAKLLNEYVGKDQYDAGRLEQELIYYIEKIDIHEEQVRLKNHCDYFRSILEEDGASKGKKLSFILQEVGREINTTGSKAYNSDIQKCVVLMKDELEKAKEQVLNVL
ncbi:MAG: YicC family protein [Pseudopedobacter saltans]|uniref:YicC family protein n=1 Tax=Pseudopedobacter saltans TaxID=151895 RepID=A0A2W5ERT8_9SPHI|nr:MAG: YicC family protein [Pseudopedobacter saltans]